MSSPAGVNRRARTRKLMIVRLALLVPLLVAVFVLHVSGEALVIVHIVRLAVLGLAVLIAGGIRARRIGGDRDSEP